MVKQDKNLKANDSNKTRFRDKYLGPINSYYQSPLNSKSISNSKTRNAITGSSRGQIY